MEQQEQYAASNWQPPPPPPGLPVETGETMTLGQTLINIFFEPARTFAALRLRPRFLVAALITIFAVTVFQIAFIQKIGLENIIRQQLNNNPQTAQMSGQDREKMMGMYSSPAFQAITYLSPVIGFVFVFLIGALLYWGLANAFGGSANFLQSLSLIAYATLPPTLIVMILNLVILLLKPAEDIELSSAQRGLAQANLSFLVDAKSSPAISAALASFDLFAFYGIFLVALGFKKIAKLSAAAAWGIAIGLWAIMLVLRIAWAIAFGSAI
jgi:hypothetical protein